MKRPRRPAKRKAVKRAAKVAKPKMPKFRLKIGTKSDPLHVDPSTIPPGIALQWVSENPDSEQQAYDHGWRSVPNMRPVKGNVLVWIAADLAETQRLIWVNKAIEQIREAEERFGVKEQREGRSIPIAPASFMVSSAYEVVPPDTDPVDVVVMVKFRLTRRFQDAAAALKLTVEQYAQRRMSLYVEGRISGLMLPAPDGHAVELHESGNFTLHSRN